MTKIRTTLIVILALLCVTVTAADAGSNFHKSTGSKKSLHTCVHEHEQMPDFIIVGGEEVEVWMFNFLYQMEVRGKKKTNTIYTLEGLTVTLWPLPEYLAQVTQPIDIGHIPVPVTFEVELLGSNVVPGPVDSPASALARLTFYPATNTLEWFVTVSGVSGETITGLHVHQGGVGEGSHVHALDLANAPFTQLSGSGQLSAENVDRLYDGTLYLNLHSTQYTTGVARGQLVLPVAPSAEHEGQGEISPPSTGDAGLTATAVDVEGDASLLAALVWLAVLTTGSLAVVRRRA